MVIFLLIAIPILLAILLFGHWIVYSAILKIFSVDSKNLILAFRILFIILSLSFIFASLLINKWSNKFLDIFYTISASWLGIFYFLFLASVIFWIFYLVGGLSLTTKYLGFGLLLVGLFLGFFTIYHSFQLKITSYSVAMPNLPENLKGKKIALISDVHLGNIRGLKFAQRLVESINLQNPDIVLIAGDYFDGPLADYKTLAAPLKNIYAADGVFFSTGNHEEFKDNEPYLEALKKAGVKILVDNFTNIGGLQIIGADYNSTKLNGLKTALQKIPFDRTKPSILMMHAPTQQQAAEEAGINLMVSGHTHKGQIWPTEYITHSVYKGFDYGMHNFGNLTAITSSGAGTWGPPQRFLTNSEIVIITLD